MEQFVRLIECVRCATARGGDTFGRLGGCVATGGRSDRHMKVAVGARKLAPIPAPRDPPAKAPCSLLGGGK